MTTKATQIIDWTPLFKYLDANFAKKSDLVDIVSKSDLTDFAKKGDLDSINTKLTNLINKQEKDNQNIIKTLNMMATKHDLGKLKEELLEKISHLPTKAQYYKTMDKWMKATSTHDIEKSAHKRAHERLSDHLSFPHTMKMV